MGASRLQSRQGRRGRSPRRREGTRDRGGGRRPDCAPRGAGLGSGSRRWPSLRPALVPGSARPLALRGQAGGAGQSALGPLASRRARALLAPRASTEPARRARPRLAAWGGGEGRPQPPSPPRRAQAGGRSPARALRQARPPVSVSDAGPSILRGRGVWLRCGEPSLSSPLPPGLRGTPQDRSNFPHSKKGGRGGFPPACLERCTAGRAALPSVPPWWGKGAEAALWHH